MDRVAESRAAKEGETERKEWHARVKESQARGEGIAHKRVKECM